jgi:hypothetical protein
MKMMSEPLKISRQALSEIGSALPNPNWCVDGDVVRVVLNVDDEGQPKDYIDLVVAQTQYPAQNDRAKHWQLRTEIKYVD